MALRYRWFFLRRGLWRERRRDGKWRGGGDWEEILSLCVLALPSVSLSLYILFGRNILDSFAYIQKGLAALRKQSPGEFIMIVVGWI